MDLRFSSALYSTVQSYNSYQQNLYLADECWLLHSVHKYSVTYKDLTIENLSNCTIFKEKNYFQEQLKLKVKISNKHSRM